MARKANSEMLHCIAEAARSDRISRRKSMNCSTAAGIMASAAAGSCTATAKVEFDQERRRRVYHDMCLLKREEDGTLLPVFNNFVHAGHGDVAHGNCLAASRECDGARAPSRWWFES
jgi:hypothetical protein